MVEFEGAKDREEGGALAARLLPWLISLGAHGVLVVLMVMFYVAYRVLEEKKEIVFPSTALVDEPNMDLVKIKLKGRSSQRKNRVKIQREDSVDRAIDHKVSDILGLGGGSTSKFSPFGKSVGGSDYVKFMGGSGGNAREIVYIIDASGSLIDNLPRVIEELKDSIRGLNGEKQRYSVIFFQEGKAIEILPRGLLKATRGVRLKRFRWLDSDAVTPGGRGKLLNAIAHGFKLLRVNKAKKPLVFILTDNITGQGKWEIEQKKLLGEIRRLNVDGVKINTIQFYEPDPLVGQGMEPTLKLIAEQSGGTYTEKLGRDIELN